jgi:hypothetical protein
MHLYYDIITKLKQLEKQNQTAPPSSILHWHRNAVGSVQWSLDGMMQSNLGTKLTE